jgi:hypothetical protein
LPTIDKTQAPSRCNSQTARVHARPAIPTNREVAADVEVSCE